MIFTPQSLYERATLRFKKIFYIFRGLFGAAKFIARMLSLGGILFEFGQKK
jgi:hypothetical protein